VGKEKRGERGEKKGGKKKGKRKKRRKIRFCSRYYIGQTGHSMNCNY
jgi:hypothetical protein